jgi:hypothetical protein
MPEFSVNPTRHDPYKNFKFSVKWDGQYIAGISKMSPFGESPKWCSTAKVETQALAGGHLGKPISIRSLLSAA